MDQVVDVSIQELLDALSRNGVPLPHEIGAFIALSVCEQLVARPRVVTRDAVFVGGDGSIRVLSEEEAPEAHATEAVVGLLGDLLVRAAPGVPGGLLSLVEAPAGERIRRELLPLRDALEAALVPLNRTATQRVLARIVRESERSRPATDGATAKVQTAQKLDALLGIDAAEADRYRVSTPEPAPAGSGPTDAAPVSDEAESGPASAGPASTAPSGAVLGAPGGARADLPAHGGLTAAGGGPSAGLSRDLAQLSEQGAGGRLRWLWLVLLALAIGVVAYWFARPGARSARPGGTQNQGSARADQGDLGGTDEGAAPEAKADQPGRVTISLSTQPGGAQVLLRVGRGGHPIEGFEKGRAFELVVVAPDGTLLGRLVVPPDAPWQHELPLRLPLPQTLAAKGSSGGTSPRPSDLGPTGLGGDLGEATGGRGQVLVEAPEDALVYQLVAISAPEATLAGLPSGLDGQLLVYRRGYAPQRIALDASALERAAREGQPVELDIVLTPAG